MEGAPYFVSWTKRALQQLDAIHRYIEQDSFKEADRVTDAIVLLTRKLPKNPTKYPPDKYRIANNGSYRSFEKYHCRVSYRILEKEIRIVQVRHTSRKPRYY